MRKVKFGKKRNNKMEKQSIKRIIKNNKELIISLIIGIAISASTVYAVTYYVADELSYDDTKVTGTLGETDVQGALTKLNEKIQDNCVGNTVKLEVIYGSVTGESTKKIKNGETGTFTINPNTNYGVEKIDCTNEQSATESNNTLTITPNKDTICTVTCGKLIKVIPSSNLGAEEFIYTKVGSYINDANDDSVNPFYNQEFYFKRNSTITFEGHFASNYFQCSDSFYVNINGRELPSNSYSCNNATGTLSFSLTPTEDAVIQVYGLGQRGELYECGTEDVTLSSSGFGITNRLYFVEPIQIYSNGIVYNWKSSGTKYVAWSNNTALPANEYFIEDSLYGSSGSLNTDHLYKGGTMTRARDYVTYSYQYKILNATKVCVRPMTNN